MYLDVNDEWLSPETISYMKKKSVENNLISKSDENNKMSERILQQEANKQEADKLESKIRSGVENLKKRMKEKERKLQRMLLYGYIYDLIEMFG